MRILHKHGFWRIGVIGNSAIAGIEVALWDILGKRLGVPIWRLLERDAFSLKHIQSFEGIGRIRLA